MRKSKLNAYFSSSAKKIEQPNENADLVPSVVQCLVSKGSTVGLLDESSPEKDKNSRQSLDSVHTASREIMRPILPSGEKESEKKS